MPENRYGKNPSKKQETAQIGWHCVATSEIYRIIYTDEDSGEITVVEADIQQDISDVPPGILSVLAASGVCLAELDELIMLEEIVYGK